jgi:hypothetical protein
LQPKGADPVLLVGDPPHRPKPYPQGKLAPFEDGSCSYRDVPQASSTSHHAPGSLPGLPVAAFRAQDSFRPTNPRQVVSAGLFRSKSVFEFEHGLRISQ